MKNAPVAVMGVPFWDNGERVERGFYGTMVVPVWYHGASRELPQEDGSGTRLLLFQMLMFHRWAFGRASVRASPNTSGKRQKSGLARTLAFP